MRKLILVLGLFLSLNCYSQETFNDVPMSTKYNDILHTIKKIDHFDFIQSHEEMTEVSIDGEIDRVIIENEEYLINIQNSLVTIAAKDGHYMYNLTVIENFLIGHGFINEEEKRHIATYYFQNDKRIKKSGVMY